MRFPSDTRRVIQPYAAVPARPPTALTVVSSPNPTDPSPSRWVAYSTSTDQAAPKVMLNVKIVATSVRTAGCRHVHASPSAMSRPRCRRGAAGSRGTGGSVIRATSSTAAPTSRAWPTTGHTAPAANSAAPSGGPASWFTVMKPVCSRAFATARSSRATSIGRKVWAALSAKISAVPSRNSAASTTPMVACPVARVAASPASTTTRAAFTATTIRRRSQRSASAPASRPNSRGGSHCRVAPSATRRASDVRDATSRGPAASAIPSPRLLTHDDASSHRKGRPSRAGATVSARRLTRAAS